ncbi:MAG TPA: hypothetical protein VFN74_18405, partial [Chloroflexota bacterium]|nr:hypothetical protein [Chloroflexota bacterium]
MKRIRRLLPLLVSLALLLSLLPGTATAQATGPYELWVVDQADAANGGSKVYIYGANQLSGNNLVGQPEVIDLEAGARGVGDGPAVRPHLLLFNANHSHGVLAAVGSGHVLFIRASDRRVVGSVDVGVQAHGAVPSADNSI